MKTYPRLITAVVISVGLLTACSSNETSSGTKSKTDLYLLDRMQQNTSGIYERSEVKASHLHESLMTEFNPDRKKRFSELEGMGKELDQALLKLIQHIETAKLEIAKQAGVNPDGKGVFKYDGNSPFSKYPFVDIDPNKPISLNFNFEEFGKEQVELMLEFRKNALAVMLNKTRTTDNKPFTFSDPNIQLNGNTEQFLQATDKAFARMKINPDDMEISKAIYIQATPNELLFKEAYQDGIHWIEKFRLLEDQKQRLLEIRQLFYAHLASKVNLSGLVDFNSIVAVAEGNESVPGGSEQTFRVFMAGVNTLEQPVLTVNGTNTTVETENGIAKVKVIIPKGASEVSFGGTISISDKTGQQIKRNWKKKFVIQK